MNVCNRGIQMLMLVVLARLLSPRDFGLFGITLLVFSAMRSLTEIGIDAALIQQRDEDVDSYLNTVWLLEIARGASIAAVLFVTAPLVASFFSEPRAASLFRVMALSPLLLGLRNPGVVYFQKSLEFHKQFVYQLSGAVVMFLLTVGYAFAYRSVWSLVFGFVAADVTRMIVSYLMHEHRPRPAFDGSLARELIGYGKWITGSSILTFLYNEGDDVVVGWLLAPSALGFYQMAYRFANAPATEISQVIAGVMFPTYSLLQDDVELLRESFFKAVQLTTLVAFPAAVGIAAVTPTFVRGFLGPEWLPMVTTMQLLSIYGMIRALGKTYGPIWNAIGRPDYHAKISVLNVALIALLIYPATTTFGIEGTALVVAGVSLFVITPLATYVVVTAVETTYFRVVREVSYPLAASTLMGGVVVFVRDSVSVSSPATECVLLVGVGAVAYAVAVALLDTVSKWGLTENIKTITNAL